MGKNYSAKARSSIMPASRYTVKTHDHDALCNVQRDEIKNSNSICPTFYAFLILSTMERGASVSIRAYCTQIAFMTHDTITIDTSKACVEVWTLIYNSDIHPRPPIPMFDNNVVFGKTIALAPTWTSLAYERIFWMCSIC